MISTATFLLNITIRLSVRPIWFFLLTCYLAEKHMCNVCISEFIVQKTTISDDDKQNARMCVKQRQKYSACTRCTKDTCAWFFQMECMCMRTRTLSVNVKFFFLASQYVCFVLPRIFVNRTLRATIYELRYTGKESACQVPTYLKSLKPTELASFLMVFPACLIVGRMCVEL